MMSLTEAQTRRPEDTDNQQDRLANRIVWPSASFRSPPANPARTVFQLAQDLRVAPRLCAKSAQDRELTAGNHHAFSLAQDLPTYAGHRTLTWIDGTNASGRITL